MVSIYTDEVREKRYFALRKRKRLYEKCFGICFAVYALLVLAELIGGAGSRSMAVGLGVNEIAKIQHYHLLPNLLVFAVGMCGILFRKWQPALIGAAGVLLLTAFGWLTPLCIGTMGVIPLTVTVFIGMRWKALTQEEGFPRFEIDIEEQQAREKAQVSYIQNRALQQGVRTEQQPLDPHADMTDLSNAAAPDALPSALHAYHTRSAGSDPVVKARQPHFDRMQTISPEDVGGLEEL